MKLIAGLTVGLVVSFAAAVGCSAGGGGGGFAPTPGCSKGECTQCAGCVQRCMCSAGEAASFTSCTEACKIGGGGGSSAGTNAAGGAAGAGSAGGPAGGSGGSSMGGEGGGAGVPQNCQYPAGPYGTGLGQTVSPNITWEGYLDGSSSVSTVTTADLHDCDGSRNINGILLLQSATWCGACQQFASALNTETSHWRPKGGVVFTLMIEDQFSNPCDAADRRSVARCLQGVQLGSLGRPEVHVRRERLERAAAPHPDSIRAP